MSKPLRQYLTSITDPAGLKAQGYVPVSRWGRDHWSLLGYVGCRVTDNEGIMCGDHLRVNEKVHVGVPKRYRSGEAWNTDHGTRLFGFFQNKNDKTLRLSEHDDIDCLEDLEAEGMIVLGTTVSLYVQLTPKGREFEEALRRHKQDHTEKNPHTFDNFPDSNGCKALMLKYAE